MRECWCCGNNASAAANGSSAAALSTHAHTKSNAYRTLIVISVSEKTLRAYAQTSGRTEICLDSQDSRVRQVFGWRTEGSVLVKPVRALWCSWNGEGRNDL